MPIRNTDEILGIFPISEKLIETVEIGVRPRMMERERKTCAGIESNNVFWLSLASGKPSLTKRSNWETKLRDFRKKAAQDCWHAGDGAIRDGMGFSSCQQRGTTRRRNRSACLMQEPKVGAGMKCSLLAFALCAFERSD